MSAAPTTGARPGTRTRSRAALSIALLALVAILCPPARAEAAGMPKAPKGFFGVHPLHPEASDYARMGSSNVGLLRTGFVFGQTNPPSPLPDGPIAAGCADGPIAYDWTRFDAIVGGAAQQGIDVLPVVLGTPGSTERGATPLDSSKATALWKDYLTKLVCRYGPGGAFWTDNPGIPARPVRNWQIWNEPNSFNNWAKPSPAEYGKLLAKSAKAIRARDPDANIVSAGVISQPVNRRSETGDVFLKKMLKSRQAARAADTIAIHPYTGTVKDVKKQIELTRKVLDKAKLKKTPIWVTEIGWGSGQSSNPLIVPPAKQLRNLRGSFKMMLTERRRLKIGKAVWYQWQDGPDAVCGWCGTAGLLHADGSEKPLLDEFKSIARR